MLMQTPQKKSGKKEYSHPVYLVIGPGRSGTSTVARILHEKLNVKMGKNFVSSRAANPDGTYEDLDFWVVNKKLLHGEMKVADWFYITQALVTDRQMNDNPWGVKDPFFTYMVGQFITFCSTFPRIIWCARDEKLILKSMIRQWRHTPEYATKSLDGKKRCYDRFIRNLDHLTIDFEDKVLSDEEIINRIERKWMNNGG
jgi:hypothetical protein